MFTDLSPTERGARALDRIKEVFLVEEIPQALAILANSENGINDVYMNLNRQLQDGLLTRRSKLLVAIGVASAVGSQPALDFFTSCYIAAGGASSEALDAVSVATVCTVFNGYYRFRDQLPEDAKAAHEGFRAPFNANTFVKPTLSVADMETICVAVSSVNGCHKCVEGHMAKAKSVGISDAQIDEAIKAAATALGASRVVAALTVASGQTANPV